MELGERQRNLGGRNFFDFWRCSGIGLPGTRFLMPGAKQMHSPLSSRRISSVLLMNVNKSMMRVRILPSAYELSWKKRDDKQK